MKDEIAAALIGRLKNLLKPLLPHLVAVFGSTIRDARTGRKIGKAILLPWNGTVRVVGLSHAFVMPRFAKAPQTFYWHQTIEFSTYPAVDYPPLEIARERPAQGTERILWIILAHQNAPTVGKIVEYWTNFVSPEDILVAYGGESRAEFGQIKHSQKLFIEDPRLRTRAHVLEKQSYTCVLREAGRWLRSRDTYTHVYLAESDLFPVSSELSPRLLSRLRKANADVLFYHLKRVDGTNWCHLLYHQNFPGFAAFLASLSRRPERELILNAIGCGSFWTRSAFDTVAEVDEAEPVYLELFLPTVAHHLGFRVVEFSEQNPFISVIPKGRGNVISCQASGALFVHPIKKLAELPPAPDRIKPLSIS